LKSPPGTPAFNAELGRLHWITPLAIGVPTSIALMAVLWRVVNGIEKLTGLSSDAIFKAEKK
jgi:hypothetical protein